MIARIKKIITISIFIIYAFMLILNALIMIPLKLVSAEDIEYSNVLEDLRKDKSFDYSKYPSYTYEELTSANKTEVSIIQIAEGFRGELYIYTYQPTNGDLDLTCTSIAMWNEYSLNGKDFSPILYELEVVSKDSVFCKYIVKDFIVSSEAHRYYNISAIYREFNFIVDSNVSGGETNEKAIVVGQQWYCYTYNDNVMYEMNTFNVLEITPIFTGYGIMFEGYTFKYLLGTYSDCQVWIIAFNVNDYIIEHIYDAELSYKKQYVEYLGSELKTEGKIEPIYRTLYNYEDNTSVMEYSGEGLFGRKCKWNRIMKANDEVDNNGFLQIVKAQGGEFSDEAKKKISSSQWVFSYDETAYSEKTVSTASGHKKLVKTYLISELTVLRLYFQDVTGKFYNLGVVMDKTTADTIPDFGLGADYGELTDSLEKLFALISIIVLLLLIGYLTPILKYLFQALVWIINLPIKLIKSLWNGK